MSVLPFLFQLLLAMLGAVFTAGVYAEDHSKNRKMQPLE